MATQTEKWLCRELGKLGIDSNEDSARYILSMESSSDLEEYMLELLDASNSKVRFFLQELKDRYAAKGKKTNYQVYRKEMGPEPVVDKSKKKNKPAPNQPKSNANSSNPKKQVVNGNGNMPDGSSGLKLDKSHNGAPQKAGEIGVGAKKKTKYVPLYSKEGQGKTIVNIPGRHKCECQASRHKLVNNCTQCGRVVCDQEGAGPCVFCGTLVCTPEEMEILDRGTKKSEKLREQLMREGVKNSKTNGLSEAGQSLLPLGFNSQTKEEEDRALKHRDKLLEYDRTSVRRTQVIDDECDYYATDSNRWLKKDDREKLRKREEELRDSRHGSRKNRKMTFDIAGRNVKVFEEEDASRKDVYNREDAVIQEVHYGKSFPNGILNTNLVNPLFDFEPPTFMDSEPSKWGPEMFRPASDDHLDPQVSSRRIQDRELQEMSDEGMCLSMHQPWASLLVCGIKMHEGRTWYTPHRGRLWIASTAKAADEDEIRDLEQFYKHFYADMKMKFPKDYPTGCLLGCVNVDECLDQGQYREKFPEGESHSPYVFVCTNPSKLLVKFPMKGKHKIYKLDSHVHQAAKKGLR